MLRDDIHLVRHRKYSQRDGLRQTSEKTDPFVAPNRNRIAKYKTSELMKGTPRVADVPMKTVLHMMKTGMNSVLAREANMTCFASCRNSHGIVGRYVRPR